MGAQCTTTWGSDNPSPTRLPPPTLWGCREPRGWAGRHPIQASPKRVSAGEGENAGAHTASAGMVDGRRRRGAIPWPCPCAARDRMACAAEGWSRSSVDTPHVNLRMCERPIPAAGQRRTRAREQAQAQPTGTQKEGAQNRLSRFGMHCR